MNELPRRKNIRLKNYDYSQNGYYFVTICTHNKLCLFGQIVGAIQESPELAQMKLNTNGIIVESIMEDLSIRFPNVNIDNYIIMPNHIHVILVITEDGAIRESPVQKQSLKSQVGAIHESPTQKRSLLSQVVGYFKMNTSKQIHVENKDLIIWQRNYYDHVIRNEPEYQKIYEYIETNPLKWELDKYFTQGDS